MKKITAIVFFLLFISFTEAKVNSQEMTQNEMHEKRLELYKRVEAMTSVPWYYIAAIDQYERSIRFVRNDLPDPDDMSGYYITPEEWIGFANPVKNDNNPKTISFFDGVGMDANDDGKANRDDSEDLLFTLAEYLAKYGVNDNHFRIALWDYYQRDQTVRSIMANAKVYKTYERIDLQDKVFPIPKGYNYSYRSTWGAGRGWGGRRIHEGTDIFAGYGAPVRAVAYGVIELKGWNKYGGWRLGIRDINNTYHYYAHMNGYAKDLNIGDVVEPGQVIGSVGSSGYGPPGTSGKFPPHLHFGMYKDNGINEWAFDPFPHLKQWERNNK